MLRGQRDKKEPVKELKRSRGVGGKTADRKWQLCDRIQVVAHTMVEIILQLLNVSNQHAVP